jgi:hypothetical protein
MTNGSRSASPPEYRPMAAIMGIPREVVAVTVGEDHINPTMITGPRKRFATSSKRSDDLRI